jgi:hypothetical protein
MRAGIQNDLIFRDFPGFPFDFAQDREPVERPVEPRVSANPASSAGQAPYRVRGRLAGLARNDGFVELRHSLFGPGLLGMIQVFSGTLKTQSGNGPGRCVRAHCPRQEVFYDP